MRYLLTTIILLFTLGIANAQQIKEINPVKATHAPQSLKVISLKECIEVGLKQNYDLLIVRNDEQIAQNNATAANAGMLPTLDLSAGYRGSSDRTSTTPREGESYTEKGSFDQSADVGLALSWTIFDGMRIRTNYKILQEMREKGELQTRYTIEDFVANLTAEYYNLIQQTIRLKNFRYAVALSKERLRIAEERLKVGTFSRLDVLQARVDFNADSSQYMTQQEMVSSSRIRINELMAKEDLQERCVAEDSVIYINSSLKWDELSAQTLHTNTSILMADKNTEISELEFKSVKSRNFPYLRLSGGYGYTHNHFADGTIKTRGTLGPNVGLSMGFTIFDGNRRREQRNAKIEVENAYYTRKQVEQSLLADLSNFWQAYCNNLEVIELEEQNLLTAKENYEIAMERYRLGNLSGIDMREAQKSLLDAEERLLTSQYNTKLCEISLQQISGNILKYLE
ncbi:MAG: TolC family protein [Alistipes sp.]|nr:TolC family protein [Alistipes sp.]